MKSIATFCIFFRKLEHTFVHMCTKTSCPTYARALEKKWKRSRDCDAKKGVHFLGLCRLKVTRDCWLKLLWESLKYGIINYCDLIIYVCIHVHLYGDVH
jgi:hypothetical protein